MMPKSYFTNSSLRQKRQNFLHQVSQLRGLESAIAEKPETRTRCTDARYCPWCTSRVRLFCVGNPKRYPNSGEKAIARVTLDPNILNLSPNSILHPEP